MHRTYYYEIRIIKEESVIRNMYANLTEMRFYCQSTKMNEWNGKKISYLSCQLKGTNENLPFIMM